MPTETFIGALVTPTKYPRIGSPITYPAYAARGLQFTKAKQDTIKRQKPLDLFGSSTARTNTHQIISVDMLTRWFDPYDGSSWSGPVSFFTGSPGIFTNPNLLVSVDFRALDSRLRGRIKASNLNLAQSLAEYRQTSSMFVSLTDDVLRTFRSLRNGRALGDFVRILQKPRSSHEINVANRWLQYQYGLKPLMSDIYGSAEALASKIRTGMWLYVSTSSEDSVFKVHPSKVGPWGNPVYRYDVGTTKLRVKARYKISDATLKSLAQCGISNPLLLAWELIPYSFVFDWIIPVGDFLKSLDALSGVSNLQVVRSYDTSTTGTSVFLATGQKCSQYNRQYSRLIMDTTLSLPRLAYKPSQSFTAVANGVALLRQLRK